MKLTKRIKIRVRYERRSFWIGVRQLEQRHRKVNVALRNLLDNMTAGCQPILADKYTRIAGYERFTGNLARPSKPPPGVGPVLKLFVKNDLVYAIRSDGSAPVTCVGNSELGWDVVREVVIAYGCTRFLTDGECAYPHPSGNGWIIAQPDRAPMWCYADGDVYRQEFIEPITPLPALP